MKIMEEERGAPNYELQVSFSATPQAIHDMGFVQFEDNQVLSFLAPSQSSQMSQPLSGGGATTNTTTTTATTGGTSNTNPTTMGFSHNDLVTRSSWNNDQVVIRVLFKKKGEAKLILDNFIFHIMLFGIVF